MKRKTDISQIRFKYKKKPLSIKESDSNPFKQFSKWLNEAIKNKVFESTGMTLSTVNKINKVSSRIVLLKGIENNSFVFYTNINSRKSKELKNNKNEKHTFVIDVVKSVVNVLTNLGYNKSGKCGNKSIIEPIDPYAD